MKKSHKITSISAFLPCFNEEKNITPLVYKLDKVLTNITNKYEIIIVNDGSTDDTLAIANKLADKTKQIKVVSHKNNLGYGASIQTGIKASRYDWIFITDGDGQFNTAELNSFIPYTQKYQAIIGYRKNRAEGSLRAINATIFKTFIDTLLRVHVRDIDCAFKLLKADLIKSLPLSSTGAVISAEILYRLKKKKVKFKQIPVTHLPRKYGSPTGNKPTVIFKAGFEAFKLYLDLKFNKSKS